MNILPSNVKINVQFDTKPNILVNTVFLLVRHLGTGPMRAQFHRNALDFNSATLTVESSAALAGVRTQKLCANIAVNTLQFQILWLKKVRNNLL